MANTEIVRLAHDAPLAKVIAAVNALTDSALGNIGARVLMVGHDGTSTDPNLGTVTASGLYQTEIASAGTNHLKVGTDKLTVTDTAMTVGPASTFGSTVAVTGTSGFNGLASFNAGLSSTTINASGQVTFTGNTSIGDAAGDTLTVTATSTFATLATFSAGATIVAPVTGNGTLQFKTPLSAAASGALALTTTPTDITGCSLSLTPGKWLVIGVFSFIESGAGDVGSIFLGSLVTTGGTATIALSTSNALLAGVTANQIATVAQVWIVTVTATTTAKLQAIKNAGTGASTAGITHTTITAINA